MTAKTMVVTGVSSGFGLVIARQALSAGYRVMGSVRKLEDGEALRQAGGEVVLLDLMDEQSCAAFGETVTAWCDGRLDCVVHNAGTAFPAPMVGADREDLRRQFEVNAIGQMSANSYIMDALLAAGGTAIFISSISTQLPTALLGPYAASKRALEAMAEALAMEAGPLGLRVAVVRPGSYRTSIWDTSVPRGDKYLASETGPSERMIPHYKRLGEKVRRVALEQPMGDPEQLGRFVMRVARGGGGFFNTTPFIAKTMQTIRWALPVAWFHRVVRFVLGRA